MNDMRHLYGMPKSAAARQDEFKQNLRGFFQMKKQAVYDPNLFRGITYAATGIPLPPSVNAPSPSVPANGAPAEPPKGAPELEDAGSRRGRLLSQKFKDTVAAQKARKTADNWDIGYKIAQGLSPAGWLNYGKNLVSGAKNLVSGAKKGFNRAKDYMKSVGDEQTKALEEGMINQQSATGGKYDYNEVFGKQASIRNWDLVHYMLKSAAESASKCHKCGEKKGQCKCGACKGAACKKGTTQKIETKKCAEAADPNSYAELRKSMLP